MNQSFAIQMRQCPHHLLLAAFVRQINLTLFDVYSFSLQPKMMDEVLEIFNYIFTAIFALEMLLKLVGMGPYGYIKDPFNLFDGFIVIMR